jgi:hypothetical protein
MIDPTDDLELDDVAATIRAVWRADEAEWSRAAWEAWEHERTLVDVARDAMHRGDTVAALLPGRTFRGPIAAVGVDHVRIRTGDGLVDVRVTADSQLGLRVVASARTGGVRGERGVATFRARLLQLEAECAVVELGLTRGDDAVGRLRIGRDQVSVDDRDGSRLYLPIGSVTWVRPVDVD